MQTTNPDSTSLEDSEASGNGVSDFKTVRCVKSFTDLKGALIEKEIDHFAEQVRKGIDTWRTAGKILVDLSKRQPDIFRLIQARHPHISESLLQTFARIGRNEIWPPLLIDSSLGARKLLECNYALQKEYSDKPFQLAVEWKNGSIKSIEKKVSELTRAEVAVVFDGNGGINTVDQQAWRLKGSAVPAPFRIKPAEPAPEYVPERMTNVDIGYWRMVLQPDGTIACERCGKSSIAQPVRVVHNCDGLESAIVVFYVQKKQ